MKWAEVQDFLATGHLAARGEWAEDGYVELEDEDLLIYTFSYPEGVQFHPGYDDVEADDWYVVGIA